MRWLRGVVGDSTPIFNLMEAKVSETTTKSYLPFEDKVKLFEWVKKGLNHDKSSVYDLRNNDLLAVKASEELNLDIVAGTIKALKMSLGVAKRTKKEQPTHALLSAVQDRIFHVRCPFCNNVSKHAVVDM